MSTTPVLAPPTTRRTPRSVLVSLGVIPVLLLGQFALLAVVPVTIVLVVTLRNAGLRPLRWWAGLLAVVYATPLAIWLLRPDRAESLSKDIHPALLGLVVVTAVAFLIRILARRR